MTTSSSSPSASSRRRAAAASSTARRAASTSSSSSRSSCARTLRVRVRAYPPWAVSLGPVSSHPPLAAPPPDASAWERDLQRTAPKAIAGIAAPPPAPCTRASRIGASHRLPGCPPPAAAAARAAPAHALQHLPGATPPAHPSGRWAEGYALPLPAPAARASAARAARPLRCGHPLLTPWAPCARPPTARGRRAERSAAGQQRRAVPPWRAGEPAAARPPPVLLRTQKAAGPGRGGVARLEPRHGHLVGELPQVRLQGVGKPRCGVVGQGGRRGAAGRRPGRRRRRARAGRPGRTAARAALLLRGRARRLRGRGQLSCLLRVGLG